MPVLVTCPSCSQKLRIPDAVSVADCPECGQRLRLKTASPPESQSPPDDAAAVDPWDEEPRARQTERVDEFGEPVDFLPRARSSQKKRTAVPKPEVAEPLPPPPEPEPAKPRVNGKLVLAIVVPGLLLLFVAIGVFAMVWSDRIESQRTAAVDGDRDEPVRPPNQPGVGGNGQGPRQAPSLAVQEGDEPDIKPDPWQPVPDKPVQARVEQQPPEPPGPDPDQRRADPNAPNPLEGLVDVAPDFARGQGGNPNRQPAGNPPVLNIPGDDPEDVAAMQVGGLDRAPRGLAPPRDVAPPGEPVAPGPRADLPRANPAVIDLVSEASVLVSTAESTATGFCIHKSGIFVTCSSVVSGLNVGDQVSVVLGSGTDDESRIRARLARVDEGRKLALLSVIGNRDDLTALELADTDGLQQTDAVLAFGFPADAVGFAAGLNPSISVNLGRVTSLRRVQGQLKTVQIDARLRVGNAGGAVTNEEGKVIGAVMSGIGNAGPNQVVPADDIRAFANQPVVTFNPPESVSSADLSKVTKFEATIALSPWANNAADDAAVSLTIESADGKRTLPMKQGADGSYSVAAVLQNQAVEKTLAVAVTTEIGVTDGFVRDASIRIKQQKLRLSDIKTLTRQPTGVYVVRVRNRSKNIVGRFVGNPLQTLSLKLPDGSDSDLNLSRVRKLEFGAAAGARDIKMTLSVKLPGAKSPTTFERRVVVGEGGPDNPGVGAVEENGFRPLVDNARPGNAGVIAGLDVPAVRLAGKKRLNLPGNIEDVCHGGAGRYLICLIPNTEQIAIVDLATAEIIGYIPLEEPKSLIAAGLRDLVVVLPGKNQIIRYDIKTQRRELTQALPGRRPIRAIGMGSASLGPIMIWDSGLPSRSVNFLTLKSLTPMPVQRPKRYQLQGGEEIRASADGRVWLPDRASTYRLLGNTVLSQSRYVNVRDRIPSPDGNYVHTRGGAYPLMVNRRLLTPPYTVKGGTTFPALHGTMFIRYAKRFMNAPGADTSLFIQGSTEPVADLPAISDFLSGGTGALFSSLDKVVALAPAIGVYGLVGQNFVEIVPFDLVDTLESGGTDYLVVLSTPVPYATVGRSYSYRAKVLSKRGGVRVKLESGPQGMRLDESGALRWRPTSSSRGQSVSVVLAITDASEQETFHTFKVYCE